MVVLHQSHTDSKRTYRCVAECAETSWHVLRKETASVNVMLSASACMTKIGDAVALKSVILRLCYFSQIQTAHLVLKTNVRISMQFDTGANI